jgi:hypothetical protein
VLSCGLALGLAAAVVQGQSASLSPADLLKDPAVKAAIDAAKATEAQTIADQIRFCEIPAPEFKEDVRGAELTIPTGLAGTSATNPRITQFRAHIYFPPEQIYVSQAEGMFAGLRISATGQLIKRNDYKPSGEISEEEWSQRMTLIQRVADELRRFTFPGEAPSLQVKFSGDLSQFETARAEATLRGDRLQRGSYEMKDLAVAAEWTNQTLNITQCEWKDNAGSFSGRASWSRETKAAEFQARSTLDAKQFLGAFGFEQFLADLTLTSPPLIELSGSGNLAETPPRVSVIGRAVVVADRSSWHLQTSPSNAGLRGAA